MIQGEGFTLHQQLFSSYYYFVVCLAVAAAHVHVVIIIPCGHPQ